MRNYLEMRDSMNVMKAEIENRLFASPLVMPPASASDKLDPVQLKQKLNAIEKGINSIEQSQDPLAIYYRERLTVLLNATRSLLPALEKRLAMTKESISSAPTRPVSISTKNPVSPPKYMNGSASPVIHTAIPMPLPTSVRKVKRKVYFQTLGLRSMTSRAFGKKTPMALSIASHSINVPTASDSTTVNVLPASISVTVNVPTASDSVTVSVPTASDSVTVNVHPASNSVTLSALPVSTETPPVKMSPIGPSNGENPQIHNSPGMRPIAIMIENHNQARPQTGLEEAEVVYEIPVEGGITRFMALFYHVAGIIGPVRSCRDYFIDRALEVNALYVHCGGSPQGYQHIEDAKVLSIDEISNGEPFFRDMSRKPPHNLYAKMKNIIDYEAQKFPMELPYQKVPLLYGLKPTASHRVNNGVTIQYHSNYSVAYRFNSRRNSYDRYMNGLQHLDRVSMRPLTPGTIIIQEAAMKVIDEKGRQDISFIGQGRAFIMFGGTIIPAIWKKSAIREFSRFFDEQGNPIVFSNTQPIWIQVVSPTNQVTFDPPLELNTAAIVAPAKETQ
ncbi:MAG: DUF3048 domain-containing protein [Candidatus Riflebacteria bacterium]|nr:DUF3048 domain-containing protein [Candidatus Riflebacteria bacterium]